MSPDDIEEALQNFDMRIQVHGLEHARDWLVSKHPIDCAAIEAEFAARIGKLIHTDHAGLVTADHEGWYLPKPDYEMPRWAFARKQLGLPLDVVDKTSVVADEILARLHSPKAESIASRGLVLGHVQSGKTTSFLSVAAKAADVGYTLIIVLAGVHNSLRRQTQDRATRTLVHSPALWWLGTANGDFKKDGNPLSSHLAGHGKRGLLVVKKHAKILQRLAEWLEAEGDASLRKQSILVIDDEADQAGLDVSPGPELEGVHKQLMRIINLQTSTGERRVAYLAYTATPYANILTTQAEDGLYPRDFIYPLDKPTGYVGAEELFGDDRIGNPVRIEDEEDGKDGDLLTPGMRDAIRWFVVATSARGVLKGGVDKFHSSMLIHTTQLTEEQLGYRPAIEAYLAALRSEFVDDEAPMAEFYASALTQVPLGDGGFDEVAAPWSEVRKNVLVVLDRLIDRTAAAEPFQEDGKLQQAHSGVIVDNSKVAWTERLTYSDLDAGQPGVTVVVVGGNTMSRGLTLEGLVCSYFARTSKTYDSLMQMGRWFGYRPGYRHLVRIWTTQTLLDWFRELNQVEQGLRSELQWMADNDLPPSKYGPRIRVSPNMNITRAAAMRSVTKHISYSDFLLDPAWLDLSEDALTENQELFRSFVSSMGNVASLPGGSKVVVGVPVAAIRSIIERYRFHPEDRRVDAPSLLRYIDAETQAGRLAAWNVMFKSTNTTATEFDFEGAIGAVRPVRRARVDQSSVAYIRSLVDSGDHRADMHEAPPAGSSRYRGANEPPLMVVYAIDAESPPTKSGSRVALDASTNPIAFSIAFPSSPTSVDYVAPALPSAEVDLGDYADV